MSVESTSGESDGEALVELALFPLRTVLFPGGLLGLKVFEARYLDLMSRCMRNGQGFGVIALRSGHEARGGQGDEVLLEPVGVVAEIIDVDSPQSGILEVRCKGTRRFATHHVAQQADGLWVAQVALLPDDLPDDGPEARPGEDIDDDADDTAEAAAELAARGQRLSACAQALSTAIEALTAQGAEPFLPPLRLDDAGWVANRWCEILPISLGAKQKLMALDDAQLRLQLVSDFLRSKGVIAAD